MREVFADTGYWVAMISSDDFLRDVADQVASELNACQVVTSEMVLVEVLNFFARSGDRARGAAVEAIRRLDKDSDVMIIPQTSAQFAKAVDRYGSRLDQNWSLVDCSSFVLMEERGIRDALAYDIDFVQAGFNALLRSA